MNSKVVLLCMYLLFPSQFIADCPFSIVHYLHIKSGPSSAFWDMGQKNWGKGTTIWKITSGHSCFESWAFQDSYAKCLLLFPRPFSHCYCDAKNMLKILNNPGLQHLAENIFLNLDFEHLQMCQLLNQSDFGWSNVPRSNVLVEAIQRSFPRKPKRLG